MRNRWIWKTSQGGKYFKKVDPQKLKEYSPHAPTHTCTKSARYSAVHLLQCRRRLREWDIRIKKYTTYKEQEGQKVAEYIEKIDTIPQDRLVYVDGTGIDRYMYRARAWSCARKNQRAQVHECRDCSRIMLRENRVVQYDGTMESTLFEAWFKERLYPALERGKTLIMDNAAFHRKKHLERIAEASGHRVR